MLRLSRHDASLSACLSLARRAQADRARKIRYSLPDLSALDARCDRSDRGSACAYSFSAELEQLDLPSSFSDSAHLARYPSPAPQRLSSCDERLILGRAVVVADLRTRATRCAISFWMSRAFVREDVDPPERSGRKRAPSGLPPGAVNYITARGAARLQAELTKLRGSGDNAERAAELEQILASVTIVDQPDASSKNVAFGATVTLLDQEDKTASYTVVGVEALDLVPHAVRWISPF